MSVDQHRHRLLVYETADAFVDAAGGFAREGLRDQARVLAVVTQAKARWLREYLGADAERLEFVDAEAIYERHGRMFHTLLDRVNREQAAAPGGVRLIAEQALAERRPVDVRAYLRYEAAANVGFAGSNATVLCPYDASSLSDQTLQAALQTHPELADDGRARANEDFVDPRAFIRSTVREMPPPAGSPIHRLERLQDLEAARSVVYAHALAAGLREAHAEDLTTAASEALTNALIHGAAPCSMWNYLAEGYLVCHVRDHGRGLADPLAGYLPPAPKALGGRGLWIAHQFCDVVEVVSDGARTDVYLRMRT